MKFDSLNLDVNYCCYCVVYIWFCSRAFGKHEFLNYCTHTDWMALLHYCGRRFSLLCMFTWVSNRIAFTCYFPFTAELFLFGTKAGKTPKKDTFRNFHVFFTELSEYAETDGWKAEKISLANTFWLLIEINRVIKMYRPIRTLSITRNELA